MLFTYNTSIYSQQTAGVFLNTPEAYNGYTLFAPMSSKTTYLVNNCGRIINEWESEYRPSFSVYLNEDGNLVRTIKTNPLSQDSFGRGGIEIMDWFGNVLWQYDFADTPFFQHHDIALMSNGNILVLVYEKIFLEEAIDNGRNPGLISNEIWPERILELQPVGTNSANIVWEWHAWDHIVQDFDETKANYGVIANHPEKFDVNYGSTNDGDWTHFNSISYNENLDQILLSSRFFDEIYIIDHSTTTAEAATGQGGNAGKGGDLLYRWGNPQAYDKGTADDRMLFGQHDAHWIDKGTSGTWEIMMFNNGIGREENFSSAETIIPPVDLSDNYLIGDNGTYGPNDFSWHFEFPEPADFYSPYSSGAQRMPNGNTLICDALRSRFFEVDGEGAIVWDYVSPLSLTGPVMQGDEFASTNTFKVNKYNPDDTRFDGLSTLPGGLIEIDPDPAPCEIYSNPNITPTEPEFLVTIAPNPFDEFIEIKLSNPQTIDLTLYDILGKVIYQVKSTEDIVKIYGTSLPTGYYFLTVRNETLDFRQTYKVFKFEEQH